jgi:hypothetical protein
VKTIAVVVFCGILVQAAAAVTLTRKQESPNGTAYLYRSGVLEGYLCGLVQQNGTAFDVFLPALWPAPAASSTMPAVPWLHYANQRDAQDAIEAYCPTKIESEPLG